jgi:hypothetical protein
LQKEGRLDLTPPPFPTAMSPSLASRPKQSKMLTAYLMH